MDSKPTPFVKAVVKIIKESGDSSVSSFHLRSKLMGQGWGKHPAAMAMHLTKLAWKQEYITCFIWNDERYFMLTSSGSALDIR